MGAKGSLRPTVPLILRVVGGALYFIRFYATLPAETGTFPWRFLALQPHCGMRLTVHVNAGLARQTDRGVGDGYGPG